MEHCPALLGGRARCVHGVAHFVQPVLEEVTVGVEGHRGRGVSEHLLDHFDVGAGGDRQARGSVPELVWIQPSDADGLGCVIEGLVEGGHAQRRPPSDAGEDEVVGPLARDVDAQLCDQEPRNRDLPSLMRLGSPPHQALSLNRSDRGDDGRAVPGQVESVDVQGGHLAEPDSGVGEEEDDEAVCLVGAGVVTGVLVGAVYACAPRRTLLPLTWTRVLASCVASPHDQGVAASGRAGEADGLSRGWSERCFLSWCRDHGLDPLQARRPHVELYLRWMQEVQRFQPSTVSRRLSVVAGFYRTLVIDAVLEHSPAEYVPRPHVSNDSPTLGLSHLQFEALLTAGRDSTNPCDFALVAMLGLLGLRIFEATGANVADLSEVHGHRVLTVVGKGDRLAVLPLPPAVAPAVERACQGRTDGPILRNRAGARMSRHRPPAGSATWPPALESP